MSLIGHVTSSAVWPRVGTLYTYVWAGNGVFIEGRRDHLHVRFQLSSTRVRGLDGITEVFEFKLPRVPVQILQQIWTMARAQAIGNLEELYHLRWTGEAWELVRPKQSQTSATCRPLEDGPESSHARAVIEVHSHHEMQPRFSRQDDTDETGFRLYGVIGKVLSDPHIRLRVGLYGHFWEIPAGWVFELPGGLQDCIAYGMENCIAITGGDYVEEV